jgi:hypothetical protein
LLGIEFGEVGNLFHQLPVLLLCIGKACHVH